MARPRSAVCAVEGGSRPPGIRHDWFTGQRQRHHLHDTVLRRALRHAAVWQGGLPKRARPTPSATRSRCISSRPATTSARSRRCWDTATSAHHDLHARPEPQARHRPENGRPDVRPMSRLAALRSICSGIGCSALQPIGSGESRFGHGQRVATKGPGAVRRGSPPSGRRGRGSQGLPYYAGQPMQWPNCSYPYKKNEEVMQLTDLETVSA